MRIRTHLLAVAAAWYVVAPIAAAQSVGKMIVDDVKNGGLDMWAVWTSPFRASERDWLLAAASFGAFGVSMLADQPVADLMERNKESGVFSTLEPVRRGGIAYTGKFIVPPIAIAYVTGLITKNQDTRDFVMGCMSAWLAQSAVRKGTYLVVARQRPDTSPNNPNKWSTPGDWENWQQHSFPAGHFANLMSCASYWNERFNSRIGAAAAFTLAGAIGVGRLVDGGHWTSDTVLGGILGYAVGREVARRSLERKNKTADKRQAEFNVSPDQGGVRASVRITF